MTKFGNHAEPLSELFADAAIPAMRDANVDGSEIDAFYLGTAIRSLVTGANAPFPMDPYRLDRFESRSSDFDFGWIDPLPLNR